MSNKWKQAAYTLNNPEKYMGDERKLIYKSSWEERVFQLCDNNPSILKWGYEIIPIKYVKPLVGNKTRISTYWPDLYVEYVNRHGEHIRELVEVKPMKQTKPSKARKAAVRMQENYTHMVNMLKWEAAEGWCAQHGIKFSIATEQSIFGK